jgi:tetratricopeptide (TPR) repeat protein
MSSLRNHTLSFIIVLICHGSMTLRHQDNIRSGQTSSSVRTPESSVQTAGTSAQNPLLDQISLADSMIALANELITHPDKPLGPYEMVDRANSESVELYKRALAIKERVLGPRDQQVAEILCKLGYCSMTRSTSINSVPAIVGERAETLYDRALSIDESNLDRANPDHSDYVRHLVEAAEVQERFTEGLPPKLRSLVQRWCKVNGYEPNVTGSGPFLTGLGNYYAGLKQWELAEATDKQAITRLEKDHDDYNLMHACIELASLYYDLGRYQQAVPFYERAFRLGVIHDPNFDLYDRSMILSALSTCRQPAGKRKPAVQPWHHGQNLIEFYRCMRDSV